MSCLSRNDFVADYLGQTATKTRRCLDKKSGQTIKIKKFIVNDNDVYGLEALKIINEYPNVIWV